jgi:2,4-didehydro-3-deoxy-L-rhamnonate hydrolase
MRLLRYGGYGVERPALLLGDGRVVDVGQHVHDFDQQFFAADGLATLRALVTDASDQLPTVDIDSHRIGAPIAKPYQVLCIGLNYADHAAESGMDIPAEPVVFNKGPHTVVGPDDDVYLPPDSEKGDWEVELAVVIGKEARYLDSEADAAQHIAGYAISNDVSERAYQLERGGQWVKGKSCETFNPLGPWLVTPDEIGDVGALGMRLDLNGETVQDGSTATMVFSVAHCIWYLSQFMVLEPGDLINTGTPPGVGLGMSPPRFLAEGDVMELEIEQLGRQRQVVRRATR